VEISSKLGSSFSMAPFVIVVVSIVFTPLCVCIMFFITIMFIIYPCDILI
jgi:hypothetical protein